MPKNTKKGGFKAAKNYIPKGSGGSRPGHRGQSGPVSAGAKKARWGTEERDARRERTDRFPRDARDERGHRARPVDADARGGYNRDDRGAARPERGGYNRDDRGARPERGAYASGYNRDDRGAGRPERGGYNRDDRGAGRPERGGYNRDDRGARQERGGSGREFNRGQDRPARGDDRNFSPRGESRNEYRGDRAAGAGAERQGRRYFDDRGSERSFSSYADRNRDDRGAGRPERGGYNRDDRGAGRPDRGAARPDRGGYNRDDRGARPERSSYNRDDRGARPERGGYNRDDRAARPERGSYSRDDRAERGARPERVGRPARFDRDDRAPRAAGFDAKPRFTPEEDVVLERLEAQATLAADVEGVSWQDLGLGDNIARSLQDLGAPSPFPIQAATIPDVIAGRDVLGRGRTGSGKTIAFGAPLVEKLMENNGGKNRQLGRKPRALILAPTRELALQIDRTVQPIARSVGLFTTQIYGGVPQARQVGALQRGVDIIVGTPGRIEDLIEQRKLDLSEVTITVLDEADHMCDLGFLEPVQRILNRTAKGGQKLLFSATLDKGVAMLVDEFLVEPSVREVAGEDQASGTIDHRVLLVDRNDKDLIIEQLADRRDGGKTLIFSRTRAYAERLADQLEDAGIPAVSLHGDLNQARRTRNLEKLTKGRVNVLVATDVAARGIHVDDIDLVVQADPPDEYKTYMHRSGRTGRAGRTGTVLTLISRSRQRRTQELLDRAEIQADFTPFYPGDAL
ncbi:DEAD/DEAH box helicase [Lysinibacter cavernae]|uniref:Superfamily II DNA/RNA helicase n=1 Tax=Lysinibacter cavernae TaxID=1640652 RepID=A0A7X5TTL4_9MICO|nr:DEAD/DEAH box helicase [Lysinibacter cavernae]NIH54325.1 superfamily II DNA/RNA helicase [Lysinibacter cavernae]